MQDRIVFTPSEETAKMLTYLMTSQGISLAEALRRAISTETLLHAEYSLGSTISITSKEGSVRSIHYK